MRIGAKIFLKQNVVARLLGIEWEKKLLLVCWEVRARITGGKKIAARSPGTDITF